MLINKLLFFVVCILCLTSCASVDYQSLSKCSGSENLYQAPEKNSSILYGTIESIHIGTLGMEDWHSIVTHVDCQEVNSPWEVIRLPVGQHTVRIMLDENGKNVKGMIKPIPLDHSAQDLDVQIEAGKKYTLHTRLLAMWDMAFWIMQDDQVVAHTPNFKPSFAEK